jgi:hypothetical protein
MASPLAATPAMNTTVKTHFADTKCIIVVPLSLPFNDGAIDRAVESGSIRLMIKTGPFRFQAPDSYACIHSRGVQEEIKKSL